MTRPPLTLSQDKACFSDCNQNAKSRDSSSCDAEVTQILDHIAVAVGRLLL